MSGQFHNEKVALVSTEITVHTTISGIVNGEKIAGNVRASLDTDVGGRSVCEFSELPRGFTPAVFGAFA